MKRTTVSYLVVKKGILISRISFTDNFRPEVRAILMILITPALHPIIFLAGICRKKTRIGERQHTSLQERKDKSWKIAIAVPFES